MVLAIQRSTLTCLQTIARVIILNLQDKEIFVLSFILDKHSPTRLTSSFTLSFKTWSRLTRVETFCTITQTRMNTTQLTIILKKDKYTRAVFQGVYPSDELPATVASFPALFIANVDTREKPGSHWVALYFTRERDGEFFDSYGLPPSNYIGTFSSLLNNNSNGWRFNSVTLQSINSKVCGHYCSYYALFRCRNIGMSTIVHRFSKNKRRNVFLVKRFIEKTFSTRSQNISYLWKRSRSESTASSSLNTPCNWFSLNVFCEWSK